MLLTNPSITRTAACVCALAIFSTAAALHASAGQPAAPPPKAGSASVAKKVTVPEFAARNLVRITFADLGLQEQPEQRDHRLATLLLGVAQQYWDGEQVVRWRLGAATGADDRDLSIAMCKELLRRDPADTVLQYRLITLLLDDSKTADARLARLRKLLGPEGKSLDPTVRSRLAMDAGALCQQLGDEAGFVAYLKEATSLDSTNRDAAAAAAAYFSERVDDPIGRLELLANLLLAEPTDPEAQIAIARELGAIGAFEEAARFQDNVVRLVEHERVQVPPALARERLFSRWGIEGPQVVVTEINNQVEGYRLQTAQRREAMEKELLSTEGIPRPEDVRLEMLMERVRLIASVAAGDTATVKKSVADFRATALARLKELGDPRARPQEIDEAKAKDLSLLLRLGVIEAMCWANVYVAPPEPPPEMPGAQSAASPIPTTPPPASTTASPSAPATSPAPPEAPPPRYSSALEEIDELAIEEAIDPKNLDFQTARGWSMVRAGQLDEAITVLTQIGDQRVGAQLALAEAYKLKGMQDKAVEAYRLVWRGVPQSLEAMFAYHALRDMLGRKDIEPELVKRAKTFAAGIPAWIDRLGEGGHILMSLQAECNPPRVTGLEPSKIKIKLRNLAPVPLGLGSDRSLNAQILVGSSMEVGMSSVRAYLTPEITSLSRRFRLKPNETVETEYWPDAGSAGWVIEECCDRSVRQRWRIVQGFAQSEDGTISTGPMCLSRETGAQVRLPVPEAALSNAELADKLANAGEDDLPGTVAMIRKRLLNPETDATGITATVPDKEIAAFASAAAARYPTLSVTGRLMLVAVLPQSSIIEPMKPFDDVALTETDPAVAMVVLITRVFDAASPFLATCSASEDKSLSAAAAILSERLSAGQSGYAERGGPDVHGIIQDSKAAQDDLLGLGKGPGR